MQVIEAYEVCSERLLSARLSRGTADLRKCGHHETIVRCKLRIRLQAWKMDDRSHKGCELLMGCFMVFLCRTNKSPIFTFDALMLWHLGC